MQTSSSHFQELILKKKRSLNQSPSGAVKKKIHPILTLVPDIDPHLSRSLNAAYTLRQEKLGRLVYSIRVFREQIHTLPLFLSLHSFQAQ